MPTRDDLQTAFAGESQANRKYLAYAAQADRDGLPQIAKLFRTVAEAETVHAHAHFRVAGGIKSTVENIQAAIDGEHYEFQEMYPPFAAQAKAEGNKPAETAFRYAMAVEKIHHGLYTRALKAAQAGQDLPAEKMFICPICGHTIAGEAPDSCPICKAAKSTFTEIP